MYTSENMIHIMLDTFPLLLSPLADSLLLPFSTLPYLLGTLLAVTGSVHLVPRLLVN
jgi:hypothetical protein